MISRERIWYRSKPTHRRLWQIKAWEDVGTLDIEPGLLTFRGKRGTIILNQPQVVSVGPSGVDWINPWVAVEAEDGQQALFADGSRFGWRGVTGGTEELAVAIEAAHRS